MMKKVTRLDRVKHISPADCSDDSLIIAISSYPVAMPFVYKLHKDGDGGYRWESMDRSVGHWQSRKWARPEEAINGMFGDPRASVFVFDGFKDFAANIDVVTCVIGK